MISARVVARNSALNIVGQTAPLVIALVTIPALVHGFGADRFGVLTLVWATIGYFGLFELGLGRALTQAVAQRLGTGTQDELPAIVQAGLLLLLSLGVLGAALVAAMSATLATRILNVPPPLRDETIASFRILAAALPFVLATVGLRGIMEAHQHFGIATALRLPAALFSYVGPLFALQFSRSLVPAITVIAAGRVIMLALHLAAVLRAYTYLTVRATMRRGASVPLLRFGLWMTVSNIVSPLMVYVDRFVIGAALSLAAVTAYVTPYEAVTKLLIVPAALTTAALPALASMLVAERARMAELYEKAMRAVMLVMFPVILVTVVLAREGLVAWVGTALAQESTRVLQWLALGVFVTSLAQVPVTALHGAARPDIIAKLHVIELPIYAILMVVLMRTFGLEGVAIAWAARAAIDASALAFLAHRRLGVVLVPAHGGALVLPIMFGVIAVGAALTSPMSRVLYVIACITVFVPAAWYWLLTRTERDALLAISSGRRQRSRRAAMAAERIDVASQ